MYRYKVILLVFIIMLSMSCVAPQQDIHFSQVGNEYVLSTQQTRIVCQIEPDGLVSQHFFARDENNRFVPVMESFKPDYSNVAGANVKQLYHTGISPLRYLLTEITNEIRFDPESKSFVLSGYKDGIFFKQTVYIRSDNNIYTEVECVYPDTKNKVDFVLGTYTFHLEKAPFFTHTPALKFDNKESQQNRFNILPSNNQIIGDRSFHAPAIVLQDQKLFAALYPDLDVINNNRVVSPDARRTNWIGTNMFCVPEVKENYTLPTALDYTVNSGISNRPILAYGYADAIIGHHIRFNRPDDSTMIREFEGNRLRYAYSIKVDANAAPNSYGKISREIWEKYGHQEFERRSHLAMPFNEYHRIIDSITFRPSPYPDIDIPLAGYKNTGSWLEWEDNGVPMGGYRSAINWWNDKMHNSAFWNNAREASGFWFWGTRLHSAKEIERAHRIINWCLSAPRNEHGLFATLFHANSKTWALQFTDPMEGKYSFFNNESSCYDVATMSKTGAHLLHYYLTCEADQRIVEYLTPYGNWLLSVIDPRGSVPAFVSTGMEESDVLRYSAHPAASLWFLAELYNATKEKRFLDGAKKIAAYFEKEIIPEGKWIDFEQFFSCGNRPLFFERDIAQHQIARGNLCLTWASEGFAALHRATGDENDRRNGKACVDYLTFWQCSWNPHYIYTAYPFGGFGVDNADCATFLDARQADCVHPFAYWGKALGRKDLIERSISAARSSTVLINHPAHKANNIYRYTNIYPFGLGPENIDHEAVPQSAMRTHPSWGEGSGVYTGLAEALRNFEGIFVDPENKIAVGVDGVRVKDFSVDNKTVHIELEGILSHKYLKMAWEKPYFITMSVNNNHEKKWNIVVNGQKVIDTEHIQLEVDPSGNVFLVPYKQSNSK